MLGEFTLCGDVFDAPETEDDWNEGVFVKVKKQAVSCQRCSNIILECRGVAVTVSAYVDE